MQARQLNEKLLASKEPEVAVVLQAISNPEAAEDQEFTTNPTNVTVSENLKKKRSQSTPNSSNLKTIINTLNSTRLSQTNQALRMELARKQAAAQNAAGFRP